MRAAILAVLVAIFCGLSRHADAAIVMHVDTVVKEVYFTGSDAGILDQFDYLYWYYPSPPGLFVGYETVGPLRNGFDFVPDQPTQDDFLFSYDDGTVVVLLAWAGNSTNQLSTTANGTAFSYAGWGPISQASLEAAIGHTLTVDPDASGWADMEVVGVPEPNSLVLLGLGGLALLRRRRNLFS